MEIFNIYLPIAQQEFSIILLVGIGFCVGVLGGFFGVGGAWIVTPALNIFGFRMAYAIGTDFAHIFGKSIVATSKHGKMGNVDWKLGITAMAGTLPGIWFGRQVVMLLESLGGDIVGSTVRYVYILMLFGLGTFMLYDYFVLRHKKLAKATATSTGVNQGSSKAIKKSLIEKIRTINLPPMISYEKSNIESISFWVIFSIFFLCGFISGFLGVGGGFIKMPALVYLIGCPTALAVGTDLFIVLLDGAWGSFLYSLSGRTDILAALIMLCGAAVGAQIGVTAVKYIRGYGIRLLFAIMIIFAGSSILIKQIDTISKGEFLALKSPAFNLEKVPVEGKLTWSKLSSVKNYNVVLAKDSTLTEVVAKNSDIPKDSSAFHYKGLETGTKYFWKVSAIKKDGKIIESKISSFTTDLTNEFNPEIKVAENPKKMSFLESLSGWVIMTSASIMCLIIMVRLFIAVRKEKREGIM